MTTDGFICDAIEVEMTTAVGGPLAANYVAARRSITGEDRILEVKHTARQVLAWRTRGQATLILTDGEKPILAKAGLKAPGRMGQTEENNWVIHEFGERNADSRLEIEFFRLAP